MKLSAHNTCVFPQDDWSGDSPKGRLNCSTDQGNRAALSDNTFQRYGVIFIMNAAGTGKSPLTDSIWEDAMFCAYKK